MTHELILTSVSQGLEPDSRGFCAVAEDRTIPPYLRMRLETLSDFLHLFPSGSEDAWQQPVVYSHLIFPGQETPWHALSRICDAGIDFQSQPNRLAHHIVLEERQFVTEGPAWLLALPGFHVTEWLTPSVRFTQGRPLPTLTAPPPLTRRQRIARERRWLDPKKMCLDTALEAPNPESLRAAIRENEEQIVIAKPPSSPCPSWRELTGDAGWAGILAETIHTGQEAVLLFRPGQNLLPLFFEAISLLPPSFFWRASFSTWYTHLPEHVACQWKGVLVGSPQAEKAQLDQNALVLDLTGPLGAAPAGPYVEFARTGIDGTLPTEEAEENLFESDAGQDTKPYSEGDAPSPAFVSEAASSRSDEIPSPAPSGAPIIPPIIVEENSGIRSRRSSKAEGVFGKLLNMKSRHQFYLLYGVTFLLVLFLFVLVLDQMLDFGLIRWFQGSRPASKITALKTPTGQVAPQAVDPDKAAAVREERIRKQQEQRERQKAVQQQKRELLATARALRADYDKEKQKSRELLGQFLLDNRVPPILSMPVPTVKDNLVDPPEPKTFSELASLYSFGLALTLDYQPLLDIPNIQIKTKKQEFTRILTSENPLPESEPIDAKETNESSKLGESVEGSESTEQQPDDELVVPDTGRFEWIVSAVENETRRETPMFHLKLTREGLEFSWLLEGMTTQHLYDTLTAALGFLRVCVEDEKDMSKIQSIAMFQPKTEKPIMVAERFADLERPEFDIFMPFAVQPWKAIFETPVAPSEFRLEVTVSPDTVNMTENTDSEMASPSRFFGIFETDIQSAIPGQGGAFQYEPIEIAIEGRVGSDRITWTDRYMDRVKELNRELEQSRQDLKQLEDEIDKVAQQILANAPNKSELRRERNELTTKKNLLSGRQKQVEDILAKLPSAHDKIIKNQDLRFDFAVYLVPVSAKPVAEASEDGEVNATLVDESNRVRLRNEESLLILHTVREPKKTSVETPTE